MLAVLRYAAKHCLCKTPFDNTCLKCKEYAEIKENHAEDITRALGEDLIFVDNHNHMVILPRGANILAYSRGNFAAPQEED